MSETETETDADANGSETEQQASDGETETEREDRSQESESVGPTSSSRTLNELVSLLERHVGRENAITSGEIAEDVSGLKPQGTNYSTRKAVREVTMFRDVPVASSGSGYYVVASAEELDAYVDQLQQRADKIQTRRVAVMQAAHKYGVMEDPQTGIESF